MTFIILFLNSLFLFQCYYLKSLPLGTDEIRAVPKLMLNLMTNSFAQEFNFDGHGAKLAFKKTKLWELVQG